MTELEELKLAYAECSRQRNVLLNKLKAAPQPAPVQELVGWITQARCLVDAREFTEAEAKLYGWTPLCTSPQPAQPPAWWPAVENILKEYGLQAIDFVADFKAALAEQPRAEGALAQQEPKTKDVVVANMGKPFTVKAYVDPQPAQRKPLTDEEIVRMAGNHPWLHGKDRPAYIRGFYDAELFHNIKEQPAQRTWQGLTHEEIMDSWDEIRDGDWAPDFYAVIEAKLKEKNT